MGRELVSLLSIAATCFTHEGGVECLRGGVSEGTGREEDGLES